METGESGVNGAHAQRHANKENNQEHVNVVHQLLDMEGKLVWENERRRESAMTMFPVQVNCASIKIIVIAPLKDCSFVYFYCISHYPL